MVRARIMSVQRLILCACCCWTVLVSGQSDHEWGSWLEKHGKVYESAWESRQRRDTWNANHAFVEAHNKQNFTFSVALNKFADLTSEEFSKLYLSRIHTSHHQFAESNDTQQQAISNPDKVDWRDKGVITSVKNQGRCGSCWAFSATGALEAHTAIKSGRPPVALSEQQLIDCSYTFGNDGCDGGLMEYAFSYIERNGGIDSEECYPYEASEDDCRYRKTCIAATDSGYQRVGYLGNEAALETAVAQHGPVSIALDADHLSFQLYSGGIYFEPLCRKNRLNHAGLIVGYGMADEMNYWLVKNSWGADWGNNGYIMMSKNINNQCGVATEASYPLV